MRQTNSNEKVILACLVASMCTMGCGGTQEAPAYDEREYEEAAPESVSLIEMQTENPEAFFQGNLDLSDGSLHGQIGDVFVDHETDLMDGYHEDDLTLVMMQTGPNDASYAMTVLEFVGGLDHPSFAIGENSRFNLYDQYELESGDAFVQVLGCSGDNPNDWEYDNSAQDVSITVSEGSNEDQVVIQYTARFMTLLGESHLVTGQFETALLQ